MSDARGLRLRMQAWLRAFAPDKTAQSINVARIAIPGHLLMALWKVAVMIVAPSVFLLAVIVFNVGAAGAKLVAVLAHRRGAVARTRLEHELVSYRLVGVIIVVLASAFVLSCLPMLFGEQRVDRYELPIAIAIAAVAFTELILSIIGNITARRTGSLLVEAIRLVSLAGALVLLVLTQTAIMSFAYPGDPSTWNGVSGLVFGSLAALIGVHMLLRARRLHRGSGAEAVLQGQ